MKSLARPACLISKKISATPFRATALNFASGPRICVPGPEPDALKICTLGDELGRTTPFPMRLLARAVTGPQGMRHGGSVSTRSAVFSASGWAAIETDLLSARHWQAARRMH